MCPPTARVRRPVAARDREGPSARRARMGEVNGRQADRPGLAAVRSRSQNEGSQLQPIDGYARETGRFFVAPNGVDVPAEFVRPMTQLKQAVSTGTIQMRIGRPEQVARAKMVESGRESADRRGVGEHIDCPAPDQTGRWGDDERVEPQAGDQHAADRSVDRAGGKRADERRAAWQPKLHGAIDRDDPGKTHARPDREIELPARADENGPENRRAPRRKSGAR